MFTIFFFHPLSLVRFFFLISAVSCRPDLKSVIIIFTDTMSPSRTVVLVSIFIVTIMVLINDTYGAMTEAQMKQAMKTVRGMCLGKSGVTKEALDKMQEGAFDDEDRKLKCYLSCVLGMMQAVKNNKINLKMIRTQITKMLEPEIGKRILAAFEGCKETVGEDSCDLSYKFTKCIYEADPGAFIVP